MSSEVIKSNSKLRRITLAVLLIVISIIFVPSAIMKFSPSESMLVNFTKWGLTDWIIYIGVSELVGVTLLLLDKTRIYGTLILTVIMAGSIQTHFINSEPYYFQISIVIVLWITYLVINKNTTQKKNVIITKD